MKQQCKTCLHFNSSEWRCYWSRCQPIKIYPNSSCKQWKQQRPDPQKIEAQLTKKLSP